MRASLKLGYEAFRASSFFLKSLNWSSSMRSLETTVWYQSTK